MIVAAALSFDAQLFFAIGQDDLGVYYADMAATVRDLEGRIRQLETELAARNEDR